MWGGCVGVIPGMRAEMIDFLQHDVTARGHSWDIDQYFLRQRLWPTLRQSVLAHDSQFSFPGNQDFPPVPGALVDETTYIGANPPSATVRLSLDAPDGTVAEWSLLERDDEVFCRYDAVIREGCSVLHFPDFLLRKIDSGELRSRITAKAARRHD
jgi:hypothetical protein